MHSSAEIQSNTPEVNHNQLPPFNPPPSIGGSFYMTGKKPENKEEEDDISKLSSDVIEHSVVPHVLGPVFGLLKQMSEDKANRTPVESVGKAAKIDPGLIGRADSALRVSPPEQPSEQPSAVKRRPLIDFSGMDEMRKLTKK